MVVKKHKFNFSKMQWQDEKEVLDHVNAEYDVSEDQVSKKIQRFNDRIKLYTNITEDKNDRKIYVRKIYTIIQTLLSLYYNDKITVNFKGRQLADRELAENLQRLAEFDHEEMEMDKMNYQVQRDRLFFGVGIRIFDYWDTEKNIPVFKLADPRTRVPDYNPDIIKGPRFEGFELEATKYELKQAGGFFNLELLNDNYDDSVDIAKQKMAATRDLSTTNRENALPNQKYNIYYHYTYKNGVPSLLVFGNDRQLLIKVVEFEWLKVLPVVVNKYEPLRNDPFGICIPDILEDKQKAEQLFMNLNRLKAEYETWGDSFFYDPNAIKNIEDIKIPTKGPKYIAANLNINPNPIFEVPKPQVKSDSFNMPQIIEQQANVDIGIDERTLGVSGQSSITARENQRLQKNANIRFLLKNKINQRAEKHLRGIYYASYKAFFKFNSEKNIRINNGLGNIIYTVGKKDIVSDNDIDIEIVNESDSKQQNEAEKDGFLSIGMTLLNDPTIPKVSKDFAKRKMLKLMGISKEEIMVMIPPSVEEMKAKGDIEMINNDKYPEIENMNEDHWSYIIMYQQAQDTKAKTAALLARERAFILSGQQQQQQALTAEQEQGGVREGLQSGMANQMMSNRISEGRQLGSAVSLEDVG